MSLQHSKLFQAIAKINKINIVIIIILINLTNYACLLKKTIYVNDQY